MRYASLARLCALLVAAWTSAGDPSAALARMWTDATGQYALEAELIARNERSVVLQRADHELVVVPIEQLSAEDRAYLATQEAEESAKMWADGPQKWTLKGGVEITGRVVDYAARELTIQPRRRRIYVNDRPLDNLPGFYQQIVPAIVAYFEKLPQADRRALQRWLASQGGRPHTYRVEGVVIETDDGDEYGVPFFLFGDADRALLEAGWHEWTAARRDSTSSGSFAADDQAFLLASLAAARQRDAEIKREIALMQLKLQAVQAGVTSLWEVTLYPAAGQGGPPLWVAVFGRDSREASVAALEQNPGYVVGPVRRVSRRF